MTMRIDFEGGPELMAALRALGESRAVNNAGLAALNEGAGAIQQRAAGLAPVYEAKLKESIKVARGKNPRRASLQAEVDITVDSDFLTVVVGIDRGIDPPRQLGRKRGRGTYRDPGVAGHSVITEFGRPGAPAQPFMTPAWDAEAPGLTGRIISALGPAIAAEAERLERRTRKGKKAKWAT